MNNVRVLALDQALRTTGWSVFDDRELVRHGTFTVRSDADISDRLVSFMGYVDALNDAFSPDVVVFEDIQEQRNISTFKTLAMVQAALLIYCSTHMLRYEVLAPSHWRRLLGGNFGKSRPEQKKKAIDTVREMFGATVESDEADAICIGAAYFEENDDGR